MTTHGRPTQDQLNRYDMLAEEYGVKSYLDGRFGGISGSPDECIEKIRRNFDLGINQYTINVPDLDRPARLQRMMDLVISKI